MLNFELTVEEANTILGALSKSPYEQVVNLIDKMQKQAREQIDEAVEKTSGGTD